MVRTLAILGVTTTVLAAASAHAAQDNWPHWYIGLHGQVAFVQDADVEAAGVTGGEMSFDGEFGLGAALGYRPYHTGSALDNMRFELEYVYRDQEFDDISGVIGGVPGTQPLNGDLIGHSIMANAFYDFKTGTGFTPYIGGGMGVTMWEFDSSTLAVDDDDSVFSYQGMAGVYYSPSTMPHTDWGIGYRYFGTLDPEFETALGTGVEHDYDSHNLELLARFRF